MHVNKLPLLPSPNLRLLLRNDQRSCCLTTARYTSDSALTRYFGGPSVRKKRPCCASKLKFFNSSYRHFSRYSASTIMKPLTKSFSFKGYDVIGFDLDGTALRYNLAEMVPLEYNLLSRYMVDHKGYSKELLGCLTKPAEKDFLQKGLFLDADRGNILKLNGDGLILKASHGIKAMCDDEITAAYGVEKKWSVTTMYIQNPLCAWNGPLADKMRGLLDYFDISASLVFARAVEDVDARRQINGGSEEPYRVWPDILEALIHIYTRENFCNGKSEYFEQLRNDPDRYLLKTSPVVINWLKELRASKKKLYLLTGSHIDFANFTASYAMGENWRELFDVVICYARKPGFFHGLRPFHKIDGFTETNQLPIDRQLEMNSVYSMGNWNQLLNTFAKTLCKNPVTMKSLYVGDNLIQDVYAPAALANIDTVAISEEMLAECSAYNPDKFEYKDVVVSKFWNPYFSDDCNPTLWADIITKYSQICVPTLEHLASKPIDHQFSMHNKSGFYLLGQS